jgi:hypothetical protein
MRKFLFSKSGILILVLLVLTSSVTGLVLVIHFDPLCGEEVVMEEASPDGQYVATLMSRNCGATTPYVAHINLRRADSRFRKDFFSGTITDGAVFTSSKYSGERFCWSKPRQLQLGYPDSNGNEAIQTWRDVTIKSDYKNFECP